MNLPYQCRTFQISQLVTKIYEPQPCSVLHYKINILPSNFHHLVHYYIYCFLSLIQYEEENTNISILTAWLFCC